MNEDYLNPEDMDIEYFYYDLNGKVVDIKVEKEKVYPVPDPIPETRRERRNCNN